ncbi:hypothetical protein POM88_052647 [Heracleum sosnowskyi]|uniref:Uncharacterized protein n=1 Tax=Heracleum sosnowskyi TaxID=360622 RepID=A0AAD8GQV8_9APIA|nr:hypothetical protein POM88_052647 [Heracleum sosnowskyi]
MFVTLLEIDCGVKKGCGNSSEISFAEFSKEMVLAGSINGVVLVSHVGEFNGRFVGLWNPGVNRWKLIRINREGELSGRLTRTNVGLGSDKSSDDFKIIRIVTESVSETDGSLNDLVLVLVADAVKSTVNERSSRKFSRTGTQGRKSQNLSSKEEDDGICVKRRDRMEVNKMESDNLGRE